MADDKQKKDDKTSLIRVTVNVLDRSAHGYHGFWAIQRYFHGGRHDYIIPEHRLEDLRKETLLSVEAVARAPEGSIEGPVDAMPAPKAPEPQPIRPEEPQEAPHRRR